MKTEFKKFLLLWAGELISSIGGGLTSFGLTVYIFTLTGSAADTALVALLAFLPNLLLGVFAGVLADRFDRRLLMMLGDGLSALGLIYIFFCMRNGGASLLQICIGVTVSSVFSSLMDPAYKATVSDLLTQEDFVKANGLVSLAGSARYLFSPFLAGLILAVSNIEVILLIDICTFFLTVAATAVVRRSLRVQKKADKEGFSEELRQGFGAVTGNKGLTLLIVMAAFMTFCMGCMQILAEPMILSFAGSKTLGFLETICAMGMLVTGVLLGVKGLKKGIVKSLSFSLAAAGICMAGFALKENVILIGSFGFLFFAMIPVANTTLDFLVRTNIDNELLGRAFGVIGLISQMGYVFAYGLAGILADRLAVRFEISVGRGSALVIILAGAGLFMLALLLYSLKSVRSLEKTSE